MKRRCPAVLFGSVTLLLPVVLLAQPPEPRKPPKSLAPPLSLEEAGKLIGEPTRVTLHLKDTAPQQVLKEFSRASGVEVRMQYWGSEEQKKPVSIDIENQPFWQAVSALCMTLRVSVQAYGGESAIMLSPGSGDWAGEKGMELSPLVSLRLNSIHHSQRLKLQGNNGDLATAMPSDHSMSLQGTLLFDPKLRPMQGQMRLAILEAPDEKGVAVADEEGYGYGQMPLMSNLSIPLKWRADIGKKIVRLRVSSKVIVAARSETLEVTDVMNAKEVSKTVRGPQGEETYTFEEVKKVGSQYQVRIKVTRPQVLAEPEMTPQTRQILYMRREIGRQIKLTDANGRHYQWQGGGGGSEGTSVTHFGIGQEGPEKTTEPQKLVLEIPTEYRELEVPFTLKDIPLP